MNGERFSPQFDVQDLGLTDYAAAWAIQKQHHARVAAGGRPVLLLTEHRPVLTLGRKASGGENIVASHDFLAAQGIEVFPVERGGDVTYHGPGQLVMYAIFPVGRRVRDFLRLLEAATLGTLERVGLPDARPNPGYAGVYVPDRSENGVNVQQKIASIGVAIKEQVALHGVGLNVSTDLSHFELILPCGLTGTRMTSIEREYELNHLGTPPDMNAVKRAAAEAFAEHFATYDWTLPLTAVGSPA